jgi:NAD(P)-dependent dehydrogenase (short-subunit alcohol dehydrogenase family)
MSNTRKSTAVTKDYGKRTAIVTGSSRGMCVSKLCNQNCLTNLNRGKSVAIRLAEDGFDVCINDIQANQAGIDEVPSPELLVTTPTYSFC